MELNDEVTAIGFPDQDFLWIDGSAPLTGHFLSGVVFAIMSLNMTNMLLRDPQGLFYSKVLLYDRVTRSGELLYIPDTSNVRSSPVNIMCAGDKFVEFGEYGIQYFNDEFVDGIRFMCTLLQYPTCNIKLYK